MTALELPIPRWALPYLEPMRYKALKGGRASSKSHFFAGLAVEESLLNPDFDFVCLREIQKSLKFSAKKLIEGKIETFGVREQFRITETEIRRIVRGEVRGRFIFQGMQDHTADSIKSLEGFNRAWFEEASRMSQRSLELLRPTIREPGSEIWFSWNPDQPSDPIEKFLVEDCPDTALVHHINFTDNPFCPQVMVDEAALWARHDPATYGHVWLGEYNISAEDQILGGKCIVEDFEVNDRWAGPYYGADWGFSTNPSALVECYVDVEANRLYVSRELWGLHVEVEDTPRFFEKMEGAKNHVIRADSSRPEMISHMKRHGFPRMRGAEKWDGSVEDGITKLRSYEKIVMHSRCPKFEEESRLYKYKRDRLTDEVLADVVKKWDHLIDALRYAIEPLTKQRISFFALDPAA